jgi:hypothetical protein
MVRLVIVAAIGALASAGCGDDERRMHAVDEPEEPDHCGEVGPCGGDPVGTWQFTTGCLTAAGEGVLVDATSGCEGASLDYERIDTKGTITFNADGTYGVTELGVQVMAKYIIPVACIDGGSCEAAQASLEARRRFEAVSCSGTSICTCSATTPTSAVTETGEFSVYGDQLILTGLGGGDYFCVDGKILHFFSTSSDGFAIVQDSIAIKQVP